MAQEHTMAPATVPVVMLSDIHFDPYADPKKVDALRKAPASEWDAILRSPETPMRGLEFSRLQSACKARGEDTPMPLFASSLKAQQDAMPNPLFVVVSGDLMAHVFDCKFKTLFPDASEVEYSEFAAKTVAFLAWELHHTFPKAPVYFALGNNDSGCTDYREDEDSLYLKTDAKTFAASALNAANAAGIEKTFPFVGDYSVMLPAPMVKTRLLVVQDMFAAKGYATCGGDKNTASADKQVAWLRAQLTEARTHHEHVWVMGHIPPGVNSFSPKAMTQVACTTHAEADGFLRSEDLLNDLTDFSDVIALALFGHTHMDEIRLLRGKDGSIPLKIIPATTTIGGNQSAFTVAQVNPRRAVVMDYAVYNADDKSGEDAHWAKEYDYQTTYKQKDFSGESVAALLSGFLADKKLDGDASKSYARYYQTGSTIGGNLGFRAIGMTALWREYACAASDGHAAAYGSCLCSGAAK